MHKWLLITLIFIIFFVSNVVGQSSINITKSKVQRITSVYGFLNGQDYAISKIKNTFPELIGITIAAELNFAASFDSAKARIKRQLVELWGNAYFQKYFDSSLKLSQEYLQNLDFTKELAIELIGDINKRAKGIMPTPILETLLWYKYLNEPEREFIDGYTRVFRTQGHIKSKGTDWQIKVPLSWKQSEGDRPNIIQKFTSDFGNGEQMITLIVKQLDLPKNYKPSKKEVLEMFSEQEIREFIDSQSRYISYQRMKFDSIDGAALEFEAERSRMDLKIKMREISFIFYYDCKMFFLSCMTASSDVNKDLSQDMKLFSSLYRLVANSVVVNDQYK